MAEDFYFFTDFDLLDTQQADEAFGFKDNISSDTINRYLVSSVHKSTGASPRVFAVTGGRAAVYPDPNPANLDHVTIVLKPWSQPSELNGVNLPNVKYYIYRGVLKANLWDSANNVVAPSGQGNDMIDFLWISHPDSTDFGDPAPDSAILTRKDLTLPDPDETPIGFTFAKPTFAKVLPGDVIGNFDPAGFSFSIVLDDYRYDPALTILNESESVKQHIQVPVITVASTAALMLDRNSREEILHYIDPAAFYGSLYNSKFFAKHSSLPDFEISPDNIYQVLISKFVNKNSVYIDIRNEHQHSFNYYSFVPATIPEYYSKYNGTSAQQDQVKGEIENQTNTLPFFKDYYGTPQWPILKFSLGEIPASSNSKKNIFRLRLFSGNNTQPLIFLANGFRNRGLLSADFPKNETRKKKRFYNPTIEMDSFYSSFDLTTPNIDSESCPIAFYSRIHYIKQMQPVLVKTTQVGPQFFDYQFLPLKIKPVLKKNSPEQLVFTVFDTDNFVDLKQENNDFDFISKVGMAEDNKSVTLFAVPTVVRKRADKNLSLALSSVGYFKNHEQKLFLDFFDDFYAFKSLKTGTLKTPDNVQYYRFKNTKQFSVKNLFDGPSDQFFAIIFDEPNWSGLKTFIEAKIDADEIDPRFDITIIMKQRNDRDNNKPPNDFDKSVPEERYLNFKLYLKGFKVQPDIVPPVNPINDTIEQVEIDCGIFFTGKKDNEEDSVVPIFTDDSINYSLAPVQKVYSCPFIYLGLGPDNPSRPNMAEIPSGGNVATLSGLAHRVDYIYKEDFEEFIKDIYVNSVSGTSIIAGKHPSFLIYHFVLSKFISLDPGTFTVIPEKMPNDVTWPGATVTPHPWYVTHPYSGLATVGSSYFLPNYSTQAPDYSMPAVRVQLLHDSDGNLTTSSPILHDGLLMETAYLFAVWKISQDYKFVQKLAFLANVTDRINLAPDFNFMLDTYTFFHNQVSILEANGLQPVHELKNKLSEIPNGPFGSIVLKFRALFRDDLKFLDEADNLFGVLRSFIGSITPYNVFTVNSGDANTIYRILEDLRREKEEYINSYAKCVYEALGGKGINPFFINRASGRGGDTSPFPFSTNTSSGVKTGLSFFLYELQTPSSSLISQINVQDPTTIRVPLTRTDSSIPIVLHISTYGIDVSFFTVRKIVSYEYLKPDGTIETVSLIGVDQYVFNDFGYLVFGDVTKEPWVDTSGTVIARFNRSTNDLIILDPTIVSLTFEIESVGLAVDGRIPADVAEESNKDEIVTVITKSELHPTAIISYAKSFVDIFTDDVFQLSTTQKADLWNTSEFENLKKLVSLIDANSVFEVVMEGGFIGKPVVPFEFDPNKPSTYKTGDRVVFNNIIYEVTSNTNNVPTDSNVDPTDTNTGWVMVQFDPNKTPEYKVGDLISHDVGLITPTYAILKAAIDFPAGPMTFDINDWDIVATAHSNISAYGPDEVVLFNNRLYKSVTYTLNDFSPSNWILVPNVGSDLDYAFNPSNNWAPVLKPEVIDPPLAGTLTYDEFARVRYAFASIKWEALNNKFIIYIEAYASPLISRLDEVMDNKPTGVQSNMNSHTIYGQDNDADAKIDLDPGAGTNFIASYNQLLSALRCFGLLEGIVSRIKTQALATGASAGIISNIESISSNASVRTTEAGSSGSVTILEKDLTFTEFTDLKLP